MSWIKADNISEIGGIVHGFSDRGFKGDMEEAASYFGLKRIFTLNQVHSSKVFVIKEELGDSEREGDAIVTGLKGIGIGVFTADCQPILLVDANASIMAVVHAGWRGTLSQITKRTLLTMKEKYGVDPSNICAALGPSIGRCCYEVGEDVASLFKNRFENWEKFLSKRSAPKYVLDLKEANRTGLSEQGVRNIEVMDVCTKCDTEFHSYRRDGKHVGKQLSFVGLV